MTITESIVEDAALDWFGDLGYTLGHGPHMAPGEPAAERIRLAKRSWWGVCATQSGD